MQFLFQTKIRRLENKKGFPPIYNMYINKFVLYFFIEGGHPTVKIAQNGFFGIFSLILPPQSSLSTVYELIRERPIIYNYFRMHFFMINVAEAQILAKNSQKLPKNRKKL